MKALFTMILPALLLAFTSCSGTGSNDKFVGHWRVMGGDGRALSEPVTIEKQGNFYNVLRPFKDGYLDLTGLAYDKQSDMLVGNQGNTPFQVRYDKATDQLDVYFPSTQRHYLLLERASKPDRAAAILFGTVRTALADSDKARIVSQLGFMIAPEGKSFVVSNDDKKEYPFTPKASALDLNGDGIQEIYIVYVNKSAFPKLTQNGITAREDQGNSSALFTRDKNGRYEMFSLAPGELLQLPSRTNGYADLIRVRKSQADRPELYKRINNRWIYQSLSQEKAQALAADAKPLQ